MILNGLLGTEQRSFCCFYDCIPGGAEVKASACNVRDLGSIPGSGRSPGEGNGHSSILVWRIPWMEEPGGLQSMGRKELDTTEQLHFPSTEFLTLLLTMMATPFLLRDSCPQ